VPPASTPTRPPGKQQVRLAYVLEQPLLRKAVGPIGSKKIHRNR
jgi:hypothetical protein